jgi:fructose-bisphosphate aldolase, class I
MSELRRRTRRLTDGRRGILALDTVPSVLAARFRAAGVVPALTSTDAYLQMLLSTPALATDTSGVALAPAALSRAATLRLAGILVGVRADAGSRALAGQGRVTAGLDGLRCRLQRLRARGAEFAVWSVCTPLAGDPLALRTLTQNSEAAARFAAVCQDLDVVPVVRVGTRMAPARPGHRRMALACALLSVVGHFEDAGVDLAGTVLTVPCDADPTHPGAAGLLATLPPTLGGVALCSARAGGTGSVRGMDRDAVAAISSTLPPAPPWPVTFYLGREASLPALQAWRGKAAATADGQRALRSRMAAAAVAVAGGRHLRAVPTPGAG